MNASAFEIDHAFFKHSPQILTMYLITWSFSPSNFLRFVRFAESYAYAFALFNIYNLVCIKTIFFHIYLANILSFEQKLL